MKSLSFYHDLHAEYKSVVGAGTVDLMKVVSIGKKLKQEGFQAESDICFNISVKALHDFGNAGQVDNCFAMENLIYSAFVKTTENEEHYYNCFKLWTSLLQDLGRKQQIQLRQNRDARKICFVLQNAVLLGHTEVMLKVIDSWRQMNLDVEVWVAAFGSVDPAFAQMLQQRSIKLLEPIVVQGQRISLSQSFPRFRQQLDALNIHNVVWVSVPTSASYAMAMKLAPRQVFWSLKLHPVFVPEADAHICNGHESEDIRIYNGNPWTVATFPLTVALKDNQPSDIAAFRAQFPADAVLLGTLAREEKLNSQDFLTAICTILARNPKAHYIWTGRQQPANIVSAFQAAGVASRCHFVGWVDTNLVAEALDIFLETFPFGCGVTGFQAMGHGTPLLSMRAADTLYSLLVPPFKADDPRPARADLENASILTAVEPQHYVELAQRLIDDLEFREMISQREKAYYNNELEALPRYAMRLWKNFSGLDN